MWDLSACEKLVMMDRVGGKDKPDHFPRVILLYFIFNESSRDNYKQSTTPSITLTLTIRIFQIQIQIHAARLSVL